MNEYRLNVRFRMDREDERRAAEYLQSLTRGSRNQFVVNAVIAQIKAESQHDLLSEIRQMFREEIGAASFVVQTTNTNSPSELPAERQKENDLSVLQDLEMFG